MADKSNDQQDIAAEQAELERRVDAALKPDAKPEPPASPEVPDEAPEPKEEAKPEFDNDETNKAVDDIAANESDTVLAAEDAAAKASQPVEKNWKTKLKALLKNKRTWAIVAVVLLLVFAVPVTRYKVLGLVWKKTVTVTVLDSKNNTPVSNATVQLGGGTAKTDANGKARVKGSVGPNKLVVNKQYFKKHEGTGFVGLKATKISNVALVATGRQVPITVVNKVSGKPVPGAEIKVLGTTAKTNAKGKATIVLPTTSATGKGSVSLKGYNTADATFQVTSSDVPANTIGLTPEGQIYFLSNLNGTIDVVKSNLDGSGRKTVLVGTGREDSNSTSLLASRDWKYLVLKAKRSSSNPSLYLINTSNDKITEFDSGAASFTLAGWSGHNFIYDVVRDSVSFWQNGKEVIKSYNAETSQLNQLDQAQAEGSATSYAYQNFSNFYIVNSALVYTSQWYTYSTAGPYDVNGKNSTIRSVQPNGQNKKDHQNFPTNTIGYIQAALYAPQEVYFGVYSNSDNKTAYYEFENGAVNTASLDQSTFDKAYPTFLLSPDGKQTFWTELRDGKNTLFVGDANAGGKKQIASLSEYSPYGWFSDDYTLVSKNSSELYIMSKAGLAAGKTPLKITDYYKPAQTYTGYGYGYGGL